MLNTHIGKQVNIFGFSKFCKFLFDFSYANFYGFSRFCKFFMNFLGFANFYFISCKVMKAVKIEFDTS